MVQVRVTEEIINNLSKLIKVNNSSKLENYQVGGNNTFLNNYWDYNYLNQDLKMDGSLFKFDFSEVDTNFKNPLKLMLLRNIFLKENRFSTIKKKYYFCVAFIEYLSVRKIYYTNLITLELVQSFVDFDSVSERQRTARKRAIKELLMEIELSNDSINFQSVYEFLDIFNHVKLKKERLTQKYEFIPMDFYNKTVSLAIKDINNNSLYIDDKMSACMIILLAETGMRVGELLRLQINQLETIEVDSESDKFYYLNFLSYKTVRSKSFIWTKTFMTPNAVLAYSTFEKIVEVRRNGDLHLCVNRQGQRYASNATLRDHFFLRFFYRHRKIFKNIEIEPNEKKAIKYWNPSTHDLKKCTFIPKNNVETNIPYVTSHQFRVNVATILHNNGYQLDWIREHMNHLTETMTEHYIRLSKMKKENSLTIETLMTRASKNGDYLETDVNKVENELIKDELEDIEYQKIYNNINDFLKKRKLNIYSDINQIIKLLSKANIPLADMELGMCAKSFNKLCERHNYISSINDAYFIGIQINSIEDFDYTYDLFIEKTKVIKHNELLYSKNPKLINELEREIKGMKTYINKKVLPEIQLIKSEIKNNGESLVVKNYPKLKELILNINNIEKEVFTWMKQE